MTRGQFLCDLDNGSTEMGIQLDEAARERFYLYYRELSKWNRKINLVSRSEPDWVYTHFLDSLAPLALGLVRGQERVVDLGAGAGFPGVPLKIVSTGLLLGLAESSGRKCAWLRHLLRTLSLEGAQVHEGRFEDLAGNVCRKMFNLAVTRAAAKPEKMVNQAKEFLTREGRLLVYTTKDLVVDGKGKVYPYHVPGSKVPSVIWEVKY